MSEQRLDRRRHLFVYLDVIDNGKNTAIGKLADVTTEGMMVMSPDSIETGKKINIKIVFTKKYDDRSELNIDVICRWTKPSVREGYYDIGLQMVDPSLEDQALIYKAIVDIGFKN